MKKRKVIGSMIAAALAVNALAAVPFVTSAAEVKVEFEDGVFENDATVKTEGSGYSGDGYVFLGDNESTIPSVTVTFMMEEAGSYALKLGYSAPHGTKRATVVINGTIVGEAIFEESDGFTEVDFGKVALQKGENTLTLNGTWGWVNVDYASITDYVPPARPEIKATQTNTCDPKATEATKQLMAYLSSVYGKHILSGQQEIYMYGPHDVETEFEYIYKKTGHYPAIRGFDYGNFCNEDFGGDDGTTKRMLEWAKKGGIVTASFHLNVPKDFDNYTLGNHVGFDQTTYSEKTTFSPSKAIVDGTKENTYLLTALDKLAAEFNKLEEAGVPVIWRPYHEAEGGGGETGSWFWWGREGSTVYRELYVYTYKYLTEEKNCHNLIWEWNSYDFSTSAKWYPGDEYVDIIGFDKYSCSDWSTGSEVLIHNDSPFTDTFYNIMARYNNAKMVAMAENDSFSTVEQITSEKAGWLYFLTWYDDDSYVGAKEFLSDPIFNTEQDLINMYTSDYCITLDELPDFGEIEYDPDATNSTDNTQPTEPEEGHATITYDEKTGKFIIDLPEAADKIYLVAECDSDVTYANGGLGVTVEVDGEYYWANVQWQTTKNGEIEVDLAADLLNVTLDTEIIEDEAIIEAVKKALVTKKSFEGQKWYVGVGEDAADLSKVKIVDAYIKKAGEGTTDPSEEPTTEEKEPGTSEEGTPSETVKVTVYGDLDGDDDVDLIDVITLNKYLMIAEPISQQARANADVNNDGDVTPGDALNILRSVVKLITLPVD